MLWESGEAVSCSGRGQLAGDGGARRDFLAEEAAWAKGEAAASNTFRDLRCNR